MRKTLFCVPMIVSALLFTACGNVQEDVYEKLRQYYEALENCSVTAEIKCDYGSDVQNFTVDCTWNSSGTSTVTIVEPEELSGITAEFESEHMTLVYDGVSLAAGDMGGLSPAAFLPCVLDGIRTGYILEKSIESIGGKDSYRVVFDTTGETDEKVDYTVWFDEAFRPISAEVSVGGETILYGEFTNVEFGDIISDNADNADTENGTDESAK